MNPTSSQQRASPDTGWKNPIGQRPGSNSSVRKLLQLIYKVCHQKIIMTLTQTICPNYIALHASKQEARSVEVGALAPVFKKSAAELKPKQKLLKCKSTVHIATLNMRILNKIGQLAELTVSAAEYNIDILCIQEHRYHHSGEEIKCHDTGNGWTFTCVEKLPIPS